MRRYYINTGVATLYKVEHIFISSETNDLYFKKSMP